MTIMSRFRRTKKAIEENKAKVTAEEEEKKKAEQEAASAPYKHVPSHASVDALFGAPPTWKHEDRPKILEHNRRRSQRTVRRAHSTFSNASSGNATPNSQPSTPSAAPRDAYNPTWNSRIEQVSFFEQVNRSIALPKIKTQVPVASDSAAGISPSSSVAQSEVTSQTPSPVTSEVPSSSSSSSSSTSLGLEIAARAPRKPLLSDAYKHQPVIFHNYDILQRLHTSPTRKLGEAPIIKAPIVEVQVPQPAVVAPVAQAKSRWSRVGKKDEEPTKN
ncbi:hypothetical protein EAE96_000138 [Botrytis aclada]|nr:hypothetical protein EAE96_000138 [Botrytis aclada]